jgi:HlyD family secretion protein
MKRIVIPILVVAVAGALLVWHFAQHRQSNRLVLSGSIEARDADIGPLVAGRVEQVLVDEGDEVKAGQPIATLGTGLITPQVDEQEAAVAQAKAALELALAGPTREELSRARINHEAAETDRRRMEGLLKAGAISQQQYDAAAVKEATAKETLLELEHGTRPEDIAAARAELRRQELHLEYLRHQQNETQIVAPSDGVIQSIDLRPGDLVEAGRPVAKLLEPGQLWVRVYVPEPDLGHVRREQNAWITVDTWPDRKFSGKVVEISDRAEYTPRNVQTREQRSDQVFGVKIAIDPTPDLKPGMTAMVTLLPEGTPLEKPIAQEKVP